MSSSPPQPTQQPDPDPHGWRQEGMDLLRAIAAGSIVGMPLLFTMEMWWQGMTSSPLHLLAVLGLAFLANALVSYFSGFRRESSIPEALNESVSALGLGLCLSAAILALIGEIDLRSGLPEIIGKSVIEAAPVSLGVCFANSHIRGKSRTGDERRERRGDRQPAAPHTPLDRQLRQDLRDIAAGFSGAVLFAYNVAPTEEVVLIAARLRPWQQGLVVIVSMLLCYIILFAAGLKRREVYVPSLFQRPWMETLMAYAVSLVVAAALLGLVGVPEAVASGRMIIACTITLGLVATVGASAGRLIT